MSTPYKDKSIEIYLPKPHNNTNTKQHQNEKPSPYIGLYNHGNTCYLNSLMQTLFMTPIFRSSMLNWKYIDTIQVSKPDCIPYQLQKLFARLQTKVRPVEETMNLTKSFQWSNNQLSEQNDIQELCHILFEAINEPFINEIFQGEMVSAIKCLECQKVSEHNETFIDLSLPVKNNRVAIDSLEKSFKFLFSVEQLTGDNQYQCETCKKKVNAEHYYVITQLPHILICALNRFEYDINFDTKKKVNNRLTFPQTINSKEFFPSYESNESIYELYSIIIHSGSARGGHYYTITKSYEDNKWYKFDDSVVYEINIDDVIEQLYGNDQSDTSAYILLYSNCNKEKFTFDVNEDLMKEIEKEEVEYQKALEEEKERMSYMNVKVSYKEKIDFVRIKKYETISTLKQKAVEAFGLLKENIISDIIDARIKVMNSNHSKIIDVLSNEDLTLEEANINGKHIYEIETRKHGEQFSHFNPNDIIVNISLWDDSLLASKDIYKDIDSKLKRLQIDNNISYDSFIEKLKECFGLTETKTFLIMKKQDYSVNNYKLIELTKDTRDFFTEDMKLYIEKDTTIDNSKFDKLFESQIENVKIVFNMPVDTTKIKRITVKSYSFDNSIEIHPKKTIMELKEMISQIINVPTDNFIMKKNSHNGIEIKKYNETIDKYTSKCLTVYIQYGTPVKVTDMKIVIQQYLPEKEQFSLYPYKINDLGLTTINKTWTIKELISNIEKINKKFLKSNEEGYKLFLRRENNFKPGKFYNEQEVIEKTDIKENSTVIIQYLKPETIFNFTDKDTNQKNIIQFLIRFWDHSKWEMSEPYEIILDKSITIEQFSKEVITKISNGLSLNDICGVKICNNEIYFYIDDIEKKEFYSFVDFNSSFLENFPFMINNDSCMLLIKDLSKPYREPTEAEKDYYYKKSLTKKSTTIKKKPIGVKKVSSTVKSNFKKEKYKEKAMVITVKQKTEEMKMKVDSPDSMMTNSTSNSGSGKVNGNGRQELIINDNTKLNINF